MMLEQSRVGRRAVSKGALDKLPRALELSRSRDPNKARRAKAVAQQLVNRGVGKAMTARDAKRWGAGLTALGGVSGGGVYAATRDKPNAQQATIGALGGQGAYQAHNYALKHYASRHLEPKTTRSQRDKKLKPVKQVHGAYTPAMERHYPKSLPEWKVHRYLGFAGRGRLGDALGAAATAGGAAALAHDKKKPVGKAIYGYQDRKRSLPRTAEFAGGVALAAYGASRLHMVGSLAAYGARIAEKQGATPKQVDAVMSAARVVGRGTRQVTGQGEAQARKVKALANAIDAVPYGLRAPVATAAGVMLVSNARPTTRESFTPVGRY